MTLCSINVARPVRRDLQQILSELAQANKLTWRTQFDVKSYVWGDFRFLRGIAKGFFLLTGHK